MEPITRRQALLLGAVGALGVTVGAAGLAQTGLPWIPASGGVDGAGASAWLEPETLRSSGGVLRVGLVAAEQSVDIAERRARVFSYNGHVPGPTWRVRPGDRIEIRLENRLSAPTNLHTHGLHVSPTGNSDNVLITVAPGESFDYRIQLPEDHPPGTFWYHPHQHGHVADQLSGGLYGTILVEGDDVPVARERVLVLSDLSLTADGSLRPPSQMERMVGREGELVLVNGQLRPEIVARPGARERWRIINACTARYFRLALPGWPMQLLGSDSGREAEPRGISELLLAPGNRADLLVTAGSGASELRSLGYDRGAMGMMSGIRDLSGPLGLAAVSAVGDTAAPPEPIPARSADADLRGREVDARRDLTFTMGMMQGMPGMPGNRGAGMSFGIDGRSFDMDRIDQRVPAGAIEEWTIHNPTPMDHPFHLHVWPMQVIEERGRAVDAITYRDVVNVPAGSRVVVRIHFARFTGRTVFHCHILDHEDAGMMGIVSVEPA